MTEAIDLQSPAGAAGFFRTVLAAFATPATPRLLPRLPDAPPPLLPGTAAIIRALADYQTPVWLAPRLDQEEVRKFIRFHTGAPIVEDGRAAVFALLDVEDVLAHIDRFPIGTDEYPDRSAVLVVQSGSAGAAHQVDCSGPGLKETVPFGVAGTDSAFWRRLLMNTALFPLGLDFLFASPHALAALPRSTKLTLKETG